MTSFVAVWQLPVHRFEEYREQRFPWRVQQYLIHQFSQKKKLNLFSFNFPHPKPRFPNISPRMRGFKGSTLMQAFWFLRNLEPTYQRRGKAVSWRFTVNKRCGRRGEVSLSGYYVVVCIFVNECCFGNVLRNLHDFLLWILLCSYFIENLWNERDLNSIVTEIWVQRLPFM